METLNQLVKGLKSTEKRLIRKFYNSQPNGEDKKRLQLFELILAGKTASNKEACYHLYRKEPDSAFSHVKTRLKKDILDFLLLQDASRHYKSKDKRMEMEVSKQILQGQLLIARGVHKEGEKVLNKALATALEFELFAEVIRIKYILRTTCGFREGIEAFEKYNTGMDKYFQEYKKLLKIKEYNFKLRLPNFFLTNKEIDLKEYGDHIFNELDQLHDKNSSVNFSFQYYYLRVFFFQDLVKDYEKALEFAFKLLDYVENEPVYQASPNNIGGVNMLVANVLICVGDYDRAITHGRKALQYFVKGLMNELRAMEQLFFAFFRKGAYEEAKEICLEAEEHPLFSKTQILAARWRFFLANTEYMLGNSETALGIIRKNSALDKDKKGWLIGLRLLEIMVTAETDELFLLEYHLTNFKNHISRLKNANLDRAKLISKVLRDFLRNKGRYKESNTDLVKNLMTLKQGKGPYHWNPTSYEVIRFDTWFAEKMINISLTNF